MKDEKGHKSGSLSGKKFALWMIVFAVIAVVSIWAVMSQSESFSAADFFSYIKEANPFYLILALACMLGFIIFEGLAVLAICRAMGYKRGFKNGFIYAASDIYVSAITPSASGGQPASVWFMMKDGISGMTSVVILLANLVFYTISILVIGAVTFICAPGLFINYSTASKWLIIIGYCALALLAIAFIMLLFKGNFVKAVCNKIVGLLVKIKIIKRPERFYNKIESSMSRYKDCAEMILKNRHAMLLAFIFNFLQRASQITVTLFTYMSVGGSWSESSQIWFAQSYSVMGSNCMPIPGAMGISDFLLLDGFGSMMAEETAVHLALLSRAMSFYSMVLICGLAILIKYILIMKNKGKKEEEPK